MIKRVACCQPDVALTLTHNGKQGLQLSAALTDKTQRVRLTKLLGKSFVDEAVFIDITRGDMRLHGWLSGPNYTRSQQDKLWIYINQRMVRDKFMLHALRQAYADILPEGRYPACVLFLEMPLDTVDVNVHPSKYEVRLLTPRAVHDVIRLAVMEMRAIGITPQEQHQSVMSDATHIALSEGFHQPFLQQPEGYQSKSWVMLNTHFVLLTHETKPYLIHVEKLQQLARLYELEQAAMPWDARPLLLPIQLDLPPHGAAKLTAYDALLQSLGFGFKILENNTLRITAIPRALPALDISLFFNAFFNTFDGGESDLIHLLVASEPVNLQAMPDEAKEALIMYWMQLDEAEKSMSVCLDLPTCQRVLDHA